jgi:hypothetical protein
MPLQPPPPTPHPAPRPPRRLRSAALPHTGATACPPQGRRPRAPTQREARQAASAKTTLVSVSAHGPDGPRTASSTGSSVGKCNDQRGRNGAVAVAASTARPHQPLYPTASSAVALTRTYAQPAYFACTPASWRGTQIRDVGGEPAGSPLAASRAHALTVHGSPALSPRRYYAG